MLATAAAANVSRAQAAPLQCGVATNMFASNPATLTAAVQSGKLSFWWNWNTEPRIDETALSPTVVSAMHATHVPMLWGQAPPDDYKFLTAAEGHIMGYNEPDLYGPACCNCDGKQSYYPATSSGWLPLFNPASAAKFWQQTVNNITSSQHAGTTLKKIVSPSMANGAKPAAGVDCTSDPAAPGANKRCEGWMSMFKTATLQLPCTRFDGSATNCWDVIDAIQIHAYAKTAQDVLTKVDGYKTQFADDFSGSGGRSQKELWLTEVAAGSNDAAQIVPFAQGLMATSGGLADRNKYGFVARVSWFSEWFFPAFNVSGVPSKQFESWASSLFEPYGGLSKVGDAFFANCAAAAE